jgi:hypothetical protein
MKSQQRGLSLIGLLFVGVVLAFAGVVGAQVAPTLIEYQAINKATNKVAAQGGTIVEIRSNFDKAQAIDDQKRRQSCREFRLSKRNSPRWAGLSGAQILRY